jgi:6-phosphogluconate dehydrogenase (decarboxylating)
MGERSMQLGVIGLGRMGGNIVRRLRPALFARFRSREEHNFADKLLSAMRSKFGGHVEPKAEC